MRLAFGSLLLFTLVLGVAVPSGPWWSSVLAQDERAEKGSSETGKTGKTETGKTKPDDTKPDEKKSKKEDEASKPRRAEQNADSGRLEDKKPEDKKPEDKKPEDKKPAARPSEKPSDKPVKPVGKPGEKSPERPAKPAEKTDKSAERAREGTEKPDSETPNSGKPNSGRPNSGRSSFERPDVAITAGREAAAMTFARVHHPELADLLEQLKKRNKAEYERAIRELFQVSEKLAKTKERNPGRYDADVAAWKLDSRIRLLSARLVMSDNPALEAELRELLRERAERRIEDLRAERARITARIAKINEEISLLEADPDAAIQRELEKLRFQVSEQSRALKKARDKNRVHDRVE